MFLILTSLLFKSSLFKTHVNLAFNLSACLNCAFKLLPVYSVSTINPAVLNSCAKYRAYFHKKAKMLSFDEVEKRTSHVPGGVTPYGLNENVKVYYPKTATLADNKITSSENNILLSYGSLCKIVFEAVE